MFAKEEKERNIGKKNIFYISECFKSQQKDITEYKFYLKVSLDCVILISKIVHTSYGICCIE